MEGILMSEFDYSLKEVLAELKETVKQLTITVKDIQIIMAEEYVKKSELKEFSNEINTLKTQTVGWIIGVYTLVVAAISVFVAMK